MLWAEVFRSSSVLVSLFWQILTGMSITSASIFAAMFFPGPQISSICSTLGFLILGFIGLLVDKGNPPSSAVAVLSLLFPSMNYLFMIGYMCRYEEQGLPTDLLQAPKPTPTETSSSHLPGIAIWAFSSIQIILYPVLAAYVERWLYGTTSKKRTMYRYEDEEFVVRTSGLTKVYRPAVRQKWLPWVKAEDVVAVSNLNLQVPYGQIVCLLGANGSGKTTTLEMIGGLQSATSGSIHVNAARGHLGKALSAMNIYSPSASIYIADTTFRVLSTAECAVGRVDGQRACHHLDRDQRCEQEREPGRSH